MTDSGAVDVDRLAIDTLRFLAVDMVEAAQSGHPGAPMGQAPLAYLLWTRHLRFDPRDPQWPDRDRFVLSCGHASALLYGLLHLAGYDLAVEELRAFRQWGSKTPGHPESFLTAGVETTTGPLGQGLGNAVGMAIARRMLAGTFDREGFPLFSHRIWVIASDGDIMEGVTSEASSLAGHLGLGELVVFYDDNRISIDGPTDLAFSEDVGKRYEAYGWHVLRVDDVNDLEAMDAAIQAARDETERPSLVVVRTHIGYGSPGKQDSADAHGAPLGADEAKAAKENLGWPLEPAFLVPEEARAPFRRAAERGAETRRDWEAMLERYAAAHPEAAKRLAARREGRLPEGWTEKLPRWAPADGAIATRKASGAVLNAIAADVETLVGGSADLTGSNNTYLKGFPDVTAVEPAGRNLYFGVREHAMGSALNGMALSGLLRPYGGTFLIFSDYMRPAVRLAALMGLPVVYVFTHDSIFLGEDGPTHQPVSQLLSLRSIPGLVVIRPADANETAAAWRVAIERTDGPTALALTRQGLPVLEGTAEHAMEGVARGGYVLLDCDGEPEIVLLGTGSEMQLALGAARALQEDGVAARAVSLPSWELFDAQDAAYRESVLPPSLTRRLSVEAATPLAWERYVGPGGDSVGVDGFGASAPWKRIAQEYGFTVDQVLARARRLLELPIL
ncbi:MAG: transketolase [Thermoanaerobaculia bacterium]